MIHPNRWPGPSPGETSQQVLDRYSSPFMSKALVRAGHPVMLGFSAGKAVDLWGLEGADSWDQGALIRYRSRRDLLEMFEEITADESGIHAFKVAAMEKTLAFPLGPLVPAGRPSPGVRFAVHHHRIAVAVEMQSTGRGAVICPFSGNLPDTIPAEIASTARQSADQRL